MERFGALNVSLLPLFRTAAKENKRQMTQKKEFLDPFLILQTIVSLGEF